MRLEKLSDLLDLARLLSGSAEGVTLDEIADQFKVGRRTAERMRDAVEQSFGPLEIIEDGRKKRFRLSARGMATFANSPSSEEIADLDNAVRQLDLLNETARSKNLRRLSAKIKSHLREADRRRLSTDIEAILRSEGFARRVGPMRAVDEKIFSSIRLALLSQKVISFYYAPEGSGKKLHRVVPYGILFGTKYYLIARSVKKDDPVLFRLDRVSRISVTEEAGIPPEDFDIEEYANRSFGVFQEEPDDVSLRFKRSAAGEAQTFMFHPSQKMKIGKDGSVTVSFRAGGYLQIVQHLMTWGDSVEILAPQKLKDLMLVEVRKLYQHYSTQN